MHGLKSHLQKLFAYDSWANRKALDALKAAQASPSGLPQVALDSFVHLVAARRIWVGRCDKRHAIVMSFRPALGLSAAEVLLAEAEALWDSFFALLDATALDKPIQFTDSHGNPYTQRLADMLQHVALHSAHHRGQVASTLRTAGLVPQDADYYISPMAQA